VRVDHRIAKLLAEDRISTLADHGKYLLLELPTSVAIDAESVLSHLQEIAPRIVLAHSERYESLWTDPESAEEWIRRGAVLQVNAGGVTGAFGAAPQRAAFHWLSRGWVAAVATDAHSVGTRRPMMSEAIDVIEKQFGHEVARCVCTENPLRIWKGEPLASAPIPANASENAPASSRDAPDKSE
jgi:protein-tyrosine phosphatase